MPQKSLWKYAGINKEEEDELFRDAREKEKKINPSKRKGENVKKAAGPGGENPFLMAGVAGLHPIGDLTLEKKIATRSAHHTRTHTPISFLFKKRKEKKRKMGNPSVVTRTAREIPSSAEDRPWTQKPGKKCRVWNANRCRLNFWTFAHFFFFCFVLFRSLLLLLPLSLCIFECVFLFLCVLCVCVFRQAQNGERRQPSESWRKSSRQKRCRVDDGLLTLFYRANGVTASFLFHRLLCQSCVLLFYPDYGIHPSIRQRNL